MDLPFYDSGKTNDSAFLFKIIFKQHQHLKLALCDVYYSFLCMNKHTKQKRLMFRNSLVSVENRNKATSYNLKLKIYTKQAH